MGKPWSTVNECSRILYVAMTRVVECDRELWTQGGQAPGAPGRMLGALSLL